ncbi:hypothetical protein N7536_003627 [Penicillium majusculum]|uniref:Uncharacterized protein n=1 Tax=Penicillium solitum TaxID=60172 RepID=A0A1V6RJ22_9EURO|nr:uncharacterized protein PENSOL_c003G05368 [Penicillium solitum]KAJ5700614.1 hypothetical protein N7536_003627 [Penicillium majusculum]OQE01831.1 hypothetical protein PENSOL_c003G05368 [Penicillium solitum]
METEGPPSPGETPNKKKRNPSFRRALRKQGIDVPPVVPRTRDPALPPKRKRSYRKPGRKRAIKRKKTEAEAAAAAAAGETNGTSTANPPVAPTTDSHSESPIVVSSSSSSSPSPSPSPTPDVLLDFSSSPASASPPGATPSPPNAPAEHSQSAPEENNADNVVWDPVDPLGLFDELGGPLDWLSEGLFD